MIQIEIIEHCNFKCWFCAAKDIKTPKFMDLDLFKRIIKEAQECGIDRVNLIPVKGEPFLHPNIYEMLDFANAHMKHVDIFTNASAINIDKLKNINMTHTVLRVSQYGHTESEFVQLTQVNSRLFNTVHKKIKQLEQHGINHVVHVRTDEYDFDYEGHPDRGIKPIDPGTKCKYHHQPKIYVNGDITFCIMLRGEAPRSDDIFYANLNNTSLKDALEHPLRYKFFDSQKICSSFCLAYGRDCINQTSIVSVKLLHAAKNRYQENPELVDAQYETMFNKISESLHDTL